MLGISNKQKFGQTYSQISLRIIALQKQVVNSKKKSNQQMSNGIFSFGFSSSIRFDRQQMTKF